MAADFSHIPELIYRPCLVAKLQAKGEVVTDDILLEIFRRIAPPLLNDRETATVNALLTHRRGRRPRRGVVSMQWLSKRIAAIHRTDVDRDFLAVLAKRMTASRGIAELDRALQFQCRHSFRQRDILIRALCRQIRDLIQEGHAKVQHPILGEIEVPRIGGSRSEIAAIMTNDVFVRRLKIRVPSVSTIQKIAGM